jgi:hypothetical protein
MGGKTKNMIRTDLRLDLKDSGSLWSNAELDRAYEKAVSDFSRFYPRQKVLEDTLDFTITDESITSPATTNLTAICSAVDINVAAGSTLTISGQPDVPRVLTLTITDANSSTYGATFTVRGTDKSGKALIEQFHYNRGMSKTLTGKKEFKTVYEVELESDSGSGAGDTLSIGYSTTYTSWVYLAYRPIDEKSETITNAAGTTTYTRDTDYIIDYFNGRIKLLSGGSMAASTSYLIDYKKDNINVDLSSIPDLIRVDRVEYPVGDVPQSMVPYECYENEKLVVITGKSGDTEGQEIMSESDHIRVYYSAEHQPALDDMPGSIPDFLENTVSMAASAYALFQYALKLEHQTTTDLTAAGTALTSATTAQTAVDTALTNMKKYLDNNSAADAESALAAGVAVFTSIATAIANITKYLDGNTGADAAGALTAMATDLTAFDTALTNATKYASNNAGADAAGAAGNAAVATLHTAIGTALTKITTYIENNTNNDAKTMLSGMSTDLTAFDTALTDATTVLDNNSGADAKELLKDITDDAANLRTAIETAVDAIATALGSVTTVDIAAANTAGALMDEAAVLAGTDLTTGAALINTVTVGGEQAEVPLAYAKNAEMHIGVTNAYGSQQAGYNQTATARTNAAMGYMQEAAQRLSNLRSYIEQSQAYTQLGSAFVNQANAVFNKLQIYLGKSAQYIDMAAGFARNAEIIVTQIQAYMNQANAYVSISDQFNQEATNIVQKLSVYIAKSNQYTNIAQGFANEANVYMAEVEAYITTAQGYIAISNAFGIEAQQRIAQIEAYISQAQRYVEISNSDMSLADRYRAEAQERRDEVYGIWRDKNQWVGSVATGSVRQAGAFSQNG